MAANEPDVSGECASYHVHQISYHALCYADDLRKVADGGPEFLLHVTQEEVASIASQPAQAIYHSHVECLLRLRSKSCPIPITNTPVSFASQGGRSL